MRLRFLGTGTSYGVPRIGCSCATCLSADPRDKRLRSSVLLESSGRRLLIDTTPDLRTQFLREGIGDVDGVCLTHFHSDHTMGIDDLRAITDAKSAPLPVCIPENDLGPIRASFPHLFHETRGPSAYLRAIPAISGETLDCSGFTVLPLRVPHGKGWTTGWVIDQKVAYFTDLSSMPAPVLARIRGVPLLVLDMLREEAHPTHLCLEQSLEIAAEVRAGSTCFIHMSHEVRHADVEKKLPSGLRLAYDGLVVDA